MSKKDRLLEDIDDESSVVPVGLVAAVLVLELAALACAVLIRFSAF
jgi:hypothetical protein